MKSDRVPYEQSPSPKNAEEYGVYVERFIAFCDDMPIRYITKKHVLAYGRASGGNWSASRERCPFASKPGDVSFFDMETIDDTPGQETRRKTRSSRRCVPIHDKLIERGLIQYVEAQRKAG